MLRFKAIVNHALFKIKVDAQMLIIKLVDNC